MTGGALNIVLMKTDNSFVFVYEVSSSSQRPLPDNIRHSQRSVCFRPVNLRNQHWPDADVPQSVSVPPDFLRPSRIQKQCYQFVAIRLVLVSVHSEHKISVVLWTWYNVTSAMCTLNSMRMVYCDAESSFFAVALRPNAGHGLLILEVFEITHDNAPQSVGLLWTSDQLIAETSTWWHTTLTTDKHDAPGGIRTHDLSRRAAADLRLTPCGHWDRRQWHMVRQN